MGPKTYLKEDGMIEGAPRATTGLRGLLWIAQVRPFTVTENPPLRSKNK